MVQIIMESDNDFQLPLNFIQVKRKQLKLNASDNTQTNCKNDDFQSVCGRNIEKAIYFQSNQQNIFQSQSQDFKQLFRVNKYKRGRAYKIKQLMQQSSIQQKILLQVMNKRQKRNKYMQKYRIKKVLTTNGDLSTLRGLNFPVIDLQSKNINIERKNKLVYVDAKHLPNDDADVDQCTQIPSLSYSNKIPQYSASFCTRKAVYQMNKPLHQKNTYKFNVLWWQNQKKVQTRKQTLQQTKQRGGKKQLKRQKQREKNRQKQTPGKQKEKHKNSMVQGEQQQQFSGEQYFQEQVRRNLKRQLKPLRRHKLIGSKFARLSDFMSVGVFEKDGIRDGKCIDSSQSQDQAGRFDYYDEKAIHGYQGNQAYIDLQDDPSKDTSAKDTYKQKQIFQMNRTYKVCQQPTVQNRLRRALNKMKQNNWIQDRLFTKGVQQQGPILIQ